MSPLNSKKTVKDPVEDFESQGKKALLEFERSRTTAEDTEEKKSSKGFERSMRLNMRTPIAQRLRNDTRVSAINEILRKKSDATQNGQFLNMINVDVLKSNNN